MRFSSPIGIRPLQVTRTPFYYGWVILLVAGLATFASAPGQTYLFSVFVNSFTTDLRLSSTSVSSLYLVASLSAGLIVVVIGRALDRFGARVLLVAVSVVLGAGALWISQATSGLALLVGITTTRCMGQGAMALIPATMVGLWFDRRRANALALMSIGNALSSGMYPVYATFLLNAVGWRQAWVVIGLTTVVVLTVPAALFVRRTPESVGLAPDGRRADEDAAPSDAESGSSGGSAARRADSLPGATTSEAARTRAFWMLQMATVSSAVIGTGVMFHQIALMTDRGIDAGISASVFAVTALAMLAGQFIYGFCESRVPARFLLAAGNVAMVVPLLLLLLVSNAWQAYLYGATLGLTNGFLINGRQSVLPTYFGRRHLGSIMGIATLTMMMTAACGPLPLAIAKDVTGSYEVGIAAFIGLLPVCALAALLAGPPTAALRAGSRAPAAA